MSGADVSNTVLTQTTGVFNLTFHKDDDPIKSADANALKNASSAANAGTETASLVLRGYPLLKAKTTIEITGVGKGSGIWYCKTVVQQWHVDHGYITNVQLIKGKGGGNSGGGSGGSSSGDSVSPATPNVK